MKHCLNCGEGYHRIRFSNTGYWNQSKYCSVYCRTLYGNKIRHEKRMKNYTLRGCKLCKIIFKPIMKHPNQMYCSRSCNKKGYNLEHKVERRKKELERVHRIRPPKYLHYTKEYIIQKLQRLASQLDKTPTKKDIEHSNINYFPKPRAINNHFGSLNNAMIQANMIPNNKHGIKYSNEQLITEIKKLARKLGKTPTCTDLIQYGIADRKVYAYRFGSYNKAVELAGLSPNINSRFNIYWRLWQQHCVKMAEVMFGKENVSLSSEEIEGYPDIHIPRKRKHIDAKTTGYDDFQDQIDRYTINGYKLDFWCIHKGIENKSTRVRYYYAEDLAKIMEILGREDLAKICYQFKQNAYSIEQKELNEFKVIKHG